MRRCVGGRDRILKKKKPATAEKTAAVCRCVAVWDRSFAVTIMVVIQHRSVVMVLKFSKMYPRKK